MERNRILIGKNFLAAQMNHWMLFPACITIIGLAGGEKPHMLLWALCSVLPFLFFLARRYLHGFLAFTAAHAAGIAAAAVLPVQGTAQRIVFCAVCAAYCVHSYSLRLRTSDWEERTAHPGVAVGITAAAVLLWNYQGTGGWDSYYILSITVYMGFYFIHCYIVHYLRFLQVNSSSTGYIPAGDIFRSGLGLAAGYAAVNILIVLASANVEWLYRLLYPFKQAIFWLLGLLFSKMESGEQGQPAPGPDLPQNLEPDIAVPSGEAFWLWEVLEKIVVAIFAALIACAAVYGAVRLVKYVRDRFSAQKESGRKQEREECRDKRERCGIDRRTAESGKLFGRMRPEERIRKIFKKKMKSEVHTLTGTEDCSALERLTAKECGQRARQEELAGIYEKARYSGRPCTAEDVREAKASLRKS